MEHILGIIFASIIISYLLEIIIYRMPLMLEKEWLSECYEMLKLDAVEKEKTPFHTFSLFSYCTKCLNHMGLLRSLPYLSWLPIFNRCKHCKEHRTKQYMFIELLVPLVLFLNYFHFDLSLQFYAASIFSMILVALIFIDFNHQLLPDQLTLSLLWLGLIFSMLLLFIDPFQAITGAVAGYLFFYLIAFIFKLVTKKDGLGYGDFKLLAALGAWVGWQLLPITVLLASVLACIAGVIILATRKKTDNPAYAFGPYLAVAGWLVLLFGEQLNAWYAHLIRLAS